MKKNSEGKYTGEFKRKIIKYMQINQLSYCQAEILFDLPEGLAEKWDRIYFEEGEEGLYKNPDSTVKRRHNS